MFLNVKWFPIFQQNEYQINFFLLCYKTYSKLRTQISFPDSWFQNNWMTTELSSVEMIQLVVNKYSLTLQGHLVFPFCLLPSSFCSLQTVKTSVVVFLAENNIFFNQKFFTLNQRQTRRVKKIIWLFIQYLYC